jgi:hypothetical protein
MSTSSSQKKVVCLRAYLDEIEYKLDTLRQLPNGLVGVRMTRMLGGLCTANTARNLLVDGVLMLPVESLHGEDGNRLPDQGSLDILAMFKLGVATRSTCCA